MSSKPKHEEDSDWRWFENSENSNVPTIRNKDNAAIKDTVYDMKVMMVASPHNIGDHCNTSLSLVVSEHQIGHQSQLVGDLLFPTITRTTLASLIIGFFMADISWHHRHPLGIQVTNSKLTVRCDPTLDTVQYLGSDRRLHPNAPS